MPDEGNLDPGCSRLHHDEYETSGGLITHLQSLNSQSNGRGEGGASGRGVGGWGTRTLSGTTPLQRRRTSVVKGREGSEELKKKQVFWERFERNELYMDPKRQFLLWPLPLKALVSEQTNVIHSKDFSTWRHCNTFSFTTNADILELIILS